MEQKKSPSKDYRKKSPQFFLIGLVVALSTTLIAFEWQIPDNLIVEHNWESSVVEFTEDDVQVVLTTRVLPPPPPQPEPTIVPPIPGPEPIFVQAPAPLPKPIGPVTKDDGFDKEPEIKEHLPVITRFPEKNPEFIGGEDAMYAFLRQKLKYPKSALDMGIEAKLYVQFIVNTDGSISEVKVLKSQGYGFDQEAARVINQMPKWKPGSQGGKKVRVIYVIPIIFALK